MKRPDIGESCFYCQYIYAWNYMNNNFYELLDIAIWYACCSTISLAAENVSITSGHWLLTNWPVWSRVVMSSETNVKYLLTFLSFNTWSFIQPRAVSFSTLRLKCLHTETHTSVEYNRCSRNLVESENETRPSCIPFIKTYGFNFVVSMVRHTYNFFELILHVPHAFSSITIITIK